MPILYYKFLHLRATDDMYCPKLIEIDQAIVITDDNYASNYTGFWKLDNILPCEASSCVKLVVLHHFHWCNTYHFCCQCCCRIFLEKL